MNQYQMLSQWVLDTPSLFISDEPIVNGFPHHQSLPFPSVEYQGNSRLGFLYQDVCAKLFTHHDHSILAEEIQIHDNKKTLGAIDFILHNQRADQLEHWEVAIKFYLLYHGQWFGPNAHDRLDKKLNHMLTHQLAMSHSISFQQQYPQWSNLEAKLLMQGRLYCNPFLNEEIPSTCLGVTINPLRMNGYWCFAHQQHLINQPLYQLSKPEWIIGKSIQATLASPVKDRFIHAQTLSGEFWFIVPDTWPNV
ncbi:type II citrate synthase [Vibrio sp. 10N.286.49.B3]|uniref:DUF1853 family protein n=1 Tax=Vibrio sp. 10N.286.49.B3 TaxID=1880855 RepID=UPI000C83B539|nr:DUF1853 family protein [Vibrio sp. 10N.286.49.B3]PMH46844.1 type II citrate synthase [Vibrio sp. 10N.286.49.B3]